MINIDINIILFILVIIGCPSIFYFSIKAHNNYLEKKYIKNEKTNHSFASFFASVVFLIISLNIFSDVSKPCHDSFCIEKVWWTLFLIFLVLAIISFFMWISYINTDYSVNEVNKNDSSKISDKDVYKKWFEAENMWDISLACSLYEKAYSKDPNNIECWLSLARILKEMKCDKDVEKIYKDLLKIYPENVEILNCMNNK